MRQRNTNHPALRRLDPLVGHWHMYVLVDDVPGGRLGPVRSVHGWTDDGGFLVQRADLDPGAALDMPDLWRENLPFPTVSLTGYDDTDEQFTMLYADGRGVSRAYGLSLTDGELRMWRAAPGFHQRFSARFDGSGDALAGAWERSEDGEAWVKDFGVLYERISP
ncbi:hypothetical protein [Streptomyces sp. NPDC055134]